MGLMGRPGVGGAMAVSSTPADLAMGEDRLTGVATRPSGEESSFAKTVVRLRLGMGLAKESLPPIFLPRASPSSPPFSLRLSVEVEVELLELAEPSGSADALETPPPVGGVIIPVPRDTDVDLVVVVVVVVTVAVVVVSPRLRVELGPGPVIVGY